MAKRNNILKSLYEARSDRFRGLKSGELVNPERKNKGKAKVSIGCRCSFSGCVKRYCECYSLGGRCGEKCRCVGCKNDGREEGKKELRSGKKARGGGKGKGEVVVVVVEEEKCMEEEEGFRVREEGRDGKGKYSKGKGSKGRSEKESDVV